MPELLQPNDLRASLLKYAAFCLNRRPYFREVLRRKLVLRAQKLKLSNSSQAIVTILDDLEKSGYLNDSYLAEAFVRRQLGKGYGPRVIFLKLKALHLDRDKIEIALDQEATLPLQVEAIKKYTPKIRSSDKRKIVFRLLSRGFSSSVINKVFDSEYIED